MQSYLECIPCFFSQALRAARMAGMNDKAIREVLNTLGNRLNEIELSYSPPRIGKLVYGLINDMSGNNDPFLPAKKRHTRLALELLPRLSEYIKNADDTLDAGIRVAAAGNVIDLGAREEVVDIGEILNHALNDEHRAWDIGALRDKMECAKNIVVLGDNAGETVFDRVMLEALQKSYPNGKYIYFVRERPIINDATKSDAVEAGIADFAEIMSTGSDAPGIIWEETSEEFKNAFDNADVIISKGQGNYETLSDCEREIFFIMTVKCSVVKRHLGLPIGASVLLQHLEGEDI